jgi:hypothetical protein
MRCNWLVWQGFCWQEWLVITVLFAGSRKHLSLAVGFSVLAVVSTWFRDISVTYRGLPKRQIFNMGLELIQKPKNNIFYVWSGLRN